jgi:predicted  nucleic acid-binding Zn-ribbon protein
MAPVREVAFALECFEWAEERLDVAGRWEGLGGRRLTRPVLTVTTTAGKRRRLVALPGGQFGAAGATWRAAFAWPDDPGDIASAQLEAGGNVVVDLPLPDKRRRRRRKPPGEAADEALTAEVTALRSQVERLRTELAGREREIMRLRAELDERGDSDEGAAGPDEMTIEIERAAAAVREQMTMEIARAEQERTELEAAAAADRERAQSELDELRQAFSDAAAEVEAARDLHREELARVQEELLAERAGAGRLQVELDEATRAAAAAEAARAADAAGAAEDPVPPALTETAKHRAAAPRTQPLETVDRPGTGEPPAAADDPLSAGSPAILDPPGPLRAGSRPATPDGTEEQPARSRVPAWLRGARPQAPAEPVEAGDSGPATGSVFAAVKALLGTNGHPHDEESVEEPAPVPPPRRTASAARARAGASVAARRSPQEVWGLRILATIVVAVLLIAFLLILTRIA